eukprot:364555-Chlamydomonas_euryale.AAC.8
MGHDTSHVAKSTPVLCKGTGHPAAPTQKQAQPAALVSDPQDASGSQSPIPTPLLVPCCTSQSCPTNTKARLGAPRRATAWSGRTHTLRWCQPASIHTWYPHLASTPGHIANCPIRAPSAPSQAPCP